VKPSHMIFGKVSRFEAAVKVIDGSNYTTTFVAYQFGSNYSTPNAKDQFFPLAAILFTIANPLVKYPGHLNDRNYHQKIVHDLSSEWIISSFTNCYISF